MTEATNHIKKDPCTAASKECVDKVHTHMEAMCRENALLERRLCAASKQMRQQQNMVKKLIDQLDKEREKRYIIEDALVEAEHACALAANKQHQPTV